MRKYSKEKIPRVIIYLPFYSGTLEARHARMHDLIHYLNSRDDLRFDYKVLAERGKKKDSSRISYGSIPFLGRYTRTYKILAPRKTGKKMHAVKKSAYFPIKVVSALLVVSAFLVQKSALPVKRSNKFCFNFFQKIEPYNKTKTFVKIIWSNLKLPFVNNHIIIDRNHNFLQHDNNIKNTCTGLICSICYKAGIKTGEIEKIALDIKKIVTETLKYIKRVTAETKRIVRKVNVETKRIVRRLSVKTKRIKDPNYLARELCIYLVLVRCLFQKKVDVLHIVRPNKVSLLIDRILRYKNKRLKIVVGPNIMSYGDLKESYDVNYFFQPHIVSVLAVGSYHYSLLKDFGIPERKLKRLPPTVDSSFFKPESNEEPSSKKKMKILFASSQLAVEKGANTFLKAIKLLKQCEEVQFTVMLAGSEQLIPNVQTPYDKSLLHGIKNDIEMLGKVSRNQMPNLYQNADVYVHAGQPEAGPTTTIESLSCGTPCILPDHISFKEPELLEGCYFFKMEDSTSLKDCIVKFYQECFLQKRKKTFLPDIDENDTTNFISHLYLEAAADRL